MAGDQATPPIQLLSLPPLRPPLQPAATTEERPQSRAVVLVGVVVVIILASTGLVLIRHGLDGPPGTRSTAPVAAARPNRAVMTSDVSIGPGPVVTTTQEVTFDRPVASLTLMVPPQTTASVGGFDPRVGHVQVRLDYHAPLQVSQWLAPGDSVTVRLPVETARLEVAYVAHGTVERRGKPGDRTLALLTPLRVSPTTAMATTTHVGGTNVSAVRCVRPSGSAQHCGFESAEGWTLTQGPSQQSELVVQLRRR